MEIGGQEKPFGKRRADTVNVEGNEKDPITQELEAIRLVSTKAGVGVLRERLSETYKDNPDMLERFTDLLNAKEKQIENAGPLTLRSLE